MEIGFIVIKEMLTGTERSEDLYEFGLGRVLL